MRHEIKNEQKICLNLIKIFFIFEIRDVLSSGLYIWSYQYARFNFRGHLDLNPGSFETLMAGGIAGELL